MAHMLETIIDAQTGAQTASMAYVKQNGVPWHGLGIALDGTETVDDVCDRLGTEDYQLAPMYYEVTDLHGNKQLVKDSDYAVIRPSDGRKYANVSDGYSIHQPRQCVGFLKEFCKRGEMHLDVIGYLNNGAQMWCLADISKSANFAGDIVEGKVLICTSFDGSLATIAKPTSHRPICHNTLSYCLADSKEAKKEFRLKHNRVLDEKAYTEAKNVLGLAQKSFGQLAESLEIMSSTKVPTAAPMYFARCLSDSKYLDSIVKLNDAHTTGQNLLDAILDSQIANNDLSFSVNDLSRIGSAILQEITHGAGATMESSKGTAYGLLQGVTAYVDHIAGRQRDTALNSAWFGPGAKMKSEAMELSMELVAAIDAFSM